MLCKYIVSDDVQFFNSNYIKICYANTIYPMMIGFSFHIVSKYVRQIQYILWCSVFLFTYSISICCANTWYQIMCNLSIHIASQHVREIHYISGCLIFQFIYFLNSISTVLSKTIYCSFHQLLQFGWLKGQFKLSSSWPGLWRLKIWKVWTTYVTCFWRIEHALRICTVIREFLVWVMWWSMVLRGFEIVRVYADAKVGRFGESVWSGTGICFVRDRIVHRFVKELHFW